MNVRSKRAPRLCLHKASGQAVVTIGGKTHYLGKHGTEKARAAYRRILAEWMAAGNPPLIATDALTVVEVMARYIDWAADYYGDSGELPRIKAALKPLRKLYGPTAASEFGPLALKAVREELLKLGWVRRSINAGIGRIRRMFRWAAENELIAPAVYGGLQAVAGLRRGRCKAIDNPDIKPVSWSIVEPVLAHVSRQVAAMIRLQWLTGMRSGEVTAMRGCDLDTSGEVWLYRPARHKTQHHGHDRTVDLGPQAQEIIRGFLTTDMQRHLFSPADAEEERMVKLRASRRTPMTPSQRRRGEDRARRAARGRRRRTPGDRYDTQSYLRAVTRGIVLAFPPPNDLTDEQAAPWRAEHHWHPHQLRHSAATRIRREHGLEVARILLGHRGVVQTELYAEADRAKAREVVLKIG